LKIDESDFGTKNHNNNPRNSFTKSNTLSIMYSSMKHIVPITDLQRQAGQIIAGMSVDNEPIYVTQRGRATAVIINAERYAEIEDDLKRLDELELLELTEISLQEIAENKTISQDAVKQRLSYSLK
jgi:prevent-host-death family protein